MRRKFFLGTLVCIMVCLSLALCGSASPNENIFSEEADFVEIIVDAPNTLNNLESIYSLRALKSIVGNESEDGNVELLYNANNEAEYILVTAEEGGYAIFHRMTGSLMEAGEFGNSPYTGQTGKKYYFGPSNYVVETSSGAKTDIMRGGEITSDQLTAMHRGMAEIRSLVVERSEVTSYSSMVSSLQIANQTAQNARNNSRNIVPEPWIRNPYNNEVQAYEFTEVEHGDFYNSLTDDTQFGHNSHGSCIFVSTVLLLRYYDMFVAPGLLPNETIPQEWIDFCQRSDVPDIQHWKSKTSDPYSCEVDSDDTVYEAVHKFLIALEFQGRTPSLINPVKFGYDGYDTFKYSCSLPSCITVLNNLQSYTTDIENNVFNTVQSAVDNSDPVAITITYKYNGDEDYSGHAIVVYGYVEAPAQDYYKAHMGWPNCGSIIVPSFFASGTCNKLIVQDNHTTATAHNCTNNGVVSGQSVSCFGNEGHQIISIDNGRGHWCACGNNETHSGCGIMDAWQDYSQAGIPMSADACRELIYEYSETVFRYNQNVHFVACEECLEYYLNVSISETSTNWLEQCYMIEDFLEDNSWMKIIAPHTAGSTIAVNGQCMVECQGCGYHMYSTPHTWGTINHGTTQCVATCAICGHVSSDTQLSYVYNRYNFAKHIKICSNCGTAQEEAHKLVAGQKGCILCGFGVGGNVAQGVW